MKSIYQKPLSEEISLEIEATILAGSQDALPIIIGEETIGKDDVILAPKFNLWEDESDEEY